MSLIIFRAAIGALLIALTACAGGDTASARDSSAAVAAADTAKPVGMRRVPRPDSVRALYMNAWAAGSRTRASELIRIIDSTELNAVIVDIKESDSFIAYDSTAIAAVKEIGTDQRPATKWMPALVDTLRAHGIYSIARIVVFKDRLVAERKPEWAIQRVGGGLWRDRKGLAWVNPYDKRVWDYNIAIAREALAMGFSELQWDYVRFPDVTDRMRTTMAFPGSNGVSREDNILAFLRYTKEQLKDVGVPLAADVFGLVAHLEGDVQIGQQWEKIATATDVILPMTYPSHYYPGLYGFARPGQHPYELLYLAATDAAERTKFVKDSLKVPVAEPMPWLEAMSIRGLRFGPAELRMQMQGVYDAGLKSWALWNPGSQYDEFLPAFRPKNGGPSAIERAGWKPPTWELPRNRLSMVIRNRERPKVDSTAAKQPA
jgi:hypothetical protein